MAEERYNGWTNYATWNIALWLGNEEGSYSYWRERTQQAYDDAEAEGTFTRKEQAALDLSRQLQDEIEEGNPLADQPSMYSDLLGSAISDCNWYEIAENWLEDVEEEEPEEVEAEADE
jgi:hypothetical protein